MANIALVHCPFFSEVSTPLGLAYVASALRRHGHQVTPFDFECWLQLKDRALYRAYCRAMDSTPNELIEFVKRPDMVTAALFATEERHWMPSVTEQDRRMLGRLREYVDCWARWVSSYAPDVVMFSMYSSSALSTTLLAQKLRTMLPSCRFVIGGPGVFSDVVRDFLLTCGLADLVVQGEGEETAVEAVEGRLSLPPMGSSSFVSGKVFTASGRPRMQLASLGVPDFSGFPFPGSGFDAYRLRSHRYFELLPVSLSRGCVLKCSFCSEWVMWGAGARERPLDQVLAEMLDNGAKFKTNNFFICDSLLNTTAGRVKSVCEAFEEMRIPGQPDGIQVQFAYLRPTQLTHDEIESLGRAGFRRVSFGIESGSEDLLKMMAKGTKPPAIAEIVRKVVSQNIAVQAPFITGFPGETQKELLDSMRFFSALYESLDTTQRKLLQINHNRFRLTADSRIHQNPTKFGIQVEPGHEGLATPLSRGQAATCEALFVRWSTEDDPRDREFRAKVSASYLESFVNYPGEEPHSYVLQTGQTIGRAIQPDDRFCRGDRVVEMAGAAQGQRPLLNFYRKKPVELKGAFARIYDLAVAGHSSEQLCEELAAEFSTTAAELRSGVLATIGGLIYQGILSFDTSAMVGDPPTGAPRQMHRPASVVHDAPLMVG